MKISLLGLVVLSLSGWAMDKGWHWKKANDDNHSPSVIEIASDASDQRLEASERRILDVGSETALQRQLKGWLGFLACGNAPRSDLDHAARVIPLVERVRILAELDK